MKEYLTRLKNVMRAVEVNTNDGVPISVADAMHSMVAVLSSIKTFENKVMIVGNGGSAGIASHVAIDLTKNAGISALAFNDGAALTCIANDFSFEEVFSR